MNKIIKILERIKNTNGRIFNVVFIKKNGEKRSMTCRTGVTRHLTGAGRVYNPSDYGLITVFDMHKVGYRCINTETIQKAKIDGVTISLSSEVNI